MKRTIRLAAVAALLAFPLSGCIVDPWYADRGYDGGDRGGYHRGHHHHHHDDYRYRYGPRW